MKIFSILLVVLLLFSNVVFAQMQLKLSTNLEKQNFQVPSPDLKSNLQLELQNTAYMLPPDNLNFYKGMFILGLMADLTIPLGEEDGFKHIAGTAYSAHIMAGYLITNQFLLSLRAGYINYGTQTEEGSEQGYSYRYEDTYSQIPILLGAYYIFNMQGSFKPYIGFAVGLFLQTYAVKWSETYGQGIPAYNFDESFSASSFGIVPGVGAYFMLLSAMIHVAVEYNLLFSGIPTAEQTYTLEKGSGLNATTATDDDVKASSISFLLGVSFPIGGN
jgi:outer membrane protein W